MDFLQYGPIGKQVIDFHRGRDDANLDPMSQHDFDRDPRVPLKIEQRLMVMAPLPECQAIPFRAHR